jgi:hypothetical protein|tara:strand:- start:104 stop:301 length:198 start_codon:yes stop_codon:yes gene_type:complete
MNKIDFNKKMIGKDVYVDNHTPKQIGRVVDVINEDSFLVKMTCGQILTVSIYDIRSLENAKKKEG